ncbi:MAG: dihydrofolate reductase [Xanthomonadales bacterium]|nr:dihydrofolate reductase [Xanthomonadales bacterium]
MSAPRPACITLIAAMARDGAIGRAGAMPWHLPEDLRYFKAQTWGKPVLMGRRTFASIGRALPGRRNLVLTRSPESLPAEVEGYATLETAFAASAGATECMVVGGGEIYRAAWTLADRLLLTVIDLQVPDADTWFPEVGPTEWQLVAEQPGDPAAALRHAFREYRRI